MGKKQESTAKFKADITELKAGMQEAARQVRLANSEFKAATSGLDNWSKSADGVSAKVEALNKTLDAQKKQLEILEKEYKLTAEAQGETSKGAEELLVKINNKKAAIGKTEKELRKYNQALSDLSDESEDAADKSDKLEKELKKTNDGAKDVSEGFTVMKGAISSLIADGIKLLVVSLKEQLVGAFGDAEQAYNSFQARIGAAPEDMKKYREAINSVYKSNFGEDLADVANCMADVKEQTNELDPGKLESMTKKAITLRDTFDMDIGETLRGVNGLIVNMGLTADEAFDFIASGAQNGLNKTDELGDNLAEYTQIWGQAGFGAKNMFAILQNGLDSGAYNLDKVNDFVKEFTISLADGRIEENLGKFSEKTGKLFKAWKAGKKSAKDVFGSVIDDLAKTTNKQKALTLASETWSALGEDNAMDIITSLSEVNDKYDNVKGTMEEIQDVKYDDPLNQISELGRRFQVDFILPFAKKALPTVEKFFDFTIRHMGELGGIAKNVGIVIGAAFVGTKIASFVGTIMQMISVYGSLSAALTTATVAQGGLNVAMLANPVGILISGLALLAGGLAAYSLATQDAQSETDALTQSVEDTIRQHEDLREELKQNAESRKELSKETEIEANKAQLLMEKVEKLSEVEEKSNGQKELMANYVEELNEIYPDLNLEYDKEKDALSQSTEKLKEQVKWQKELAKIKALESASSSVMQDIVKEETNNANLKAEIEAFKEKHKNIDQLEKKLDAWAKKQQEASKYGVDLSSEYLRAYHEWAEAGGETYDKLNKKLQESNDKLKNLNGEYDETIQRISDNYNKIEIGQTFDKIAVDCEKAGVKIPQSVSDGINAGIYLVPAKVEEMKNLIKFDKAIEKAGLDGVKIPDELQKGILSGKTKVKDGIEQLKQSIDTEQKKISAQSEENAEDAGNGYAKGAERSKGAVKKASRRLNEAGVAGMESTLGLYNPLGAKVPSIVATSMTKKKGELKSATKGVAKEAKKSFDSVKYDSSGKYIVTGAASGVNNNMEPLMKAISGLAGKTLSWFKKKLGIKSPSREFEKSAKWIPAGIAKGVEKNQKVVEKSIAKLTKAAVNSLVTNTDTNYEQAGTKVAETFNKGLEASIKTRTKSFKKLVNDTVDKASKQAKSNWFNSDYEKELKELKSKYKKDSKKLSIETKKLNKKYAKEIKADFKKYGESSIEAYTTAMTNAAEKAEEKVKAAIEKLTEAAQEKYDAIYAKQTAMQEKMSGFGDLFTVDNRGNYRLANITEQTATLKDYTKNLNELKGKVSEALLEEIAEMSVEDAVGYSNALLQLSEKELTEYNKAYEDKRNYAANQAKIFYADQVRAIDNEFNAKVRAEFNKIEKDLKQAGINATKGFIKGLKKDKKGLTGAAKSLAKAVIKQVNKTLGIHSPSKVFERIGVFSGQGYVKGLNNSMKEAPNVMKSAIEKIDNGAHGGNQVSSTTVTKNYNFYQTNNSPQPLNRLEIYRQTRNQLIFAKGV